jgi:hypothetical protein
VNVALQLAGERDDNPVSLLPIHKFAIFLQFLRTNSFHKSVGSQHHVRVAKSVVCTNVNNVAKIIAGLVSEVVKFPDIEESKHIANEIFQRTGFPGAIGIIDGTHVGIIKPLASGMTFTKSFFNYFQIIRFPSQIKTFFFKNIYFLAGGEETFSNNSLILPGSSRRAYSYSYIFSRLTCKTKVRVIFTNNIRIIW